MHATSSFAYSFATGPLFTIHRLTRFQTVRISRRTRQRVLCAELGITEGAPRADHAQYLSQWLTLLKNDSRAIFTAAAKASEAVTYLKKLQAPS